MGLPAGAFHHEPYGSGGHGIATEGDLSLGKLIIEVTGYGWKLIVLLGASTKIPVAGQVGPINEPEALSMRALGTWVRSHPAGSARLHDVVFERGVGDGHAQWWLDQHGIVCVVPARDNIAATVDAHDRAAAGAGVTVGGRMHAVRHGRGKSPCTERLETEAVGRTGLATYDQQGAFVYGRHHNCRAFRPNPINAVVVHTCHNRDDGPGGNPSF